MGDMDGLDRDHDNLLLRLAERHDAFRPAPRILARTRHYLEQEVPPDVQAEIDKRRQYIREHCGRAADVRKPYRPLGTPDPDLKDPLRPARLGSKQLGRSKDDRAAQEQRAAVATEGKAEVPKAREIRRWRNTGISDLSRTLRDSEHRLRLCSHGKGFVDVLRMQSQLIIPSSQLRSMSSLWAIDIHQSLVSMEDVSHEGHRLPNIPTVSSSGVAAAPQPEAPSQPLHPIVLKAMTALGMLGHDPNTSLPVVTNARKAIIVGEDTEKKAAHALARVALSLAPDKAVDEHRKSFLTMQNKLRERLQEQLGERASMRLESYQRRYLTLPPKSTGPLSVTAWELEAEKRKLKGTLDALDNHSWWSRLMYQLTSNNAQLTAEQQVVLFILKDTIERGESFSQEDMFALLLLLPRDYHNMDEVQRILQFLREELDISLATYRSFLDRKALPVPNSLKKDQGLPGHRAWRAGLDRARTMSSAQPL